ncbi:coiled-coil domain-containing protein [Litchfieldia salsa]|uniref:Uncharacterized protein n=1 Tax=Litchfieldia salsa TaxID=930152 RepID=A0A1H0VN34_9BACI|nr:hypothetical protein [Litchfieldia salsa]SDP79917.1 hypothetical protein SAMN05216565_10795 [Litchfieldia salsa]
MLIHNIIIYDYINQRINKFDFDFHVNILVSETNTVGKSSLIKSIYHCLGYNIKIWPSNWNVNNMIFQMEVSQDDRKHLITRHKNLFYIDNRKEILTEKEFALWLQGLLSIYIKLKDKKNKNLSDVYASEILLPFYVDQDKSWNGFVYSKSSDSFGRYTNTVKSIFDFYFEIANKKLIDLEIEKSNYEMELGNTIKKVEALILLEGEHSELSLPVNIDNYIDKIKQIDDLHINNYLRKINSLNRNVSEIDNSIIEIETKINLLDREISELNKLKTNYNKKFNEIKHTCIHCNSKLTQEQSLTRLKIRNNNYEILEQIDKSKQLKYEYEDERKEIQIEKEKLLKKVSEIEKIIENNKEYQELDSYIEDRVNQGITNNFFTIEQKLLNEEKEKVSSIRVVKKEISKERKLGTQKRSEIKKKYEDLINEYERHFKGLKLDDSGFYSFKEVTGSGIDANKKMLALYTIYANLISEYSSVRVPFAMDSFIKNETATELKEQMFSFLSNYYLSINGQIFFSIISENLKYLDQNCDYNFINLEKPILAKINEDNKALVEAFEIINI